MRERNRIYQLLSVLVIVLSFYSCQSEKSSDSSLQLTTQSSKNSFLEQIYTSDQEIRIKSDLLNNSSEEYFLHWQAAQVTDSLNLLKIESYLDEYGYPDTVYFNQKAIDAPWYVIQHCPRWERRLDFFPILNNAHKDKKINDIKFYLYLSRTYAFRYKEISGIENDEELSFQEKISILMVKLKDVLE